MSAHRFAAVQAVVALEAAARGLEEAANTPSDPRTLPHFHGTPGVHAPIDQARVAAALDEILQELIPRVAAVAARLDTLRAPAEAR
jgi:hypothetical protein